MSGSWYLSPVSRTATGSTDVLDQHPVRVYDTAFLSCSVWHCALWCFVIIVTHERKIHSFTKNQIIIWLKWHIKVIYLDSWKKVLAVKWRDGAAGSTIGVKTWSHVFVFPWFKRITTFWQNLTGSEFLLLSGSLILFEHFSGLLKRLYLIVYLCLHVCGALCLCFSAL